MLRYGEKGCATYGRNGRPGERNGIPDLLGSLCLPERRRLRRGAQPGLPSAHSRQTTPARDRFRRTRCRCQMVSLTRGGNTWEGGDGCGNTRKPRATRAARKCRGVPWDPAQCFSDAKAKTTGSKAQPPRRRISLVRCLSRRGVPFAVAGLPSPAAAWVLAELAFAAPAGACVRAAVCGVV